MPMFLVIFIMSHSILIHFQLDHKSCRRKQYKRQERRKKRRWGGGSCLAARHPEKENNDLYEIALDTI